MRAYAVSLCRYLAGVCVFVAAGDAALGAPWWYAATAAPLAIGFAVLAEWIRRSRLRGGRGA